MPQRLENAAGGSLRQNSAVLRCTDYTDLRQGKTSSRWGGSTEPPLPRTTATYLRTERSAGFSCPRLPRPKNQKLGIRYC